MVRLALVGFGGYGYSLAQAIERAAAHVPCRLVAAADTRLDALANQAETLRRRGVELFADPLEMFRNVADRCDAAYIATGIGTHAPLTIAALRAGLHVHLEKPPAATVQEVDAMLDAQRATGRMCMVGFQAVHGADLRHVKQRLCDGRLGPARSIVCHCGWPRTAAYYSRNEWAGRLRTDGRWILDGPATNALAHQVMNALFLTGSCADEPATPAAVRAELYAAGPVGSHNTAAIEIRTANGPTIVLLFTHCPEVAWGPILEIDAEKGRAVWGVGKDLTIRFSGGDTESHPADGKAEDMMVRNFVEAIASGDAASLRCPLAATRGVILALDGAHESSRRIHRIGDGFFHRRDVGKREARTIVDGLDETLRRAAAARCLVSDLPDGPPWAVRTEPFELAGYRQFPVAFRCD